VRHLDLCSGIGGFALACRMVGGIETVGFCERDTFCQAVLKKHWPAVPICDDIFKLQGKDYENIDILTAGFPCQPYSVSGKRNGAKDYRAIWPQVHRAIREVRPRWIIGENVAGIINMDLNRIIADLEEAEYSVEVFVIPACAVGAKHRRERAWIVANSTGFNETQVVEEAGIPVQPRRDSMLARVQPFRWEGNQHSMAGMFHWIPYRMDRIKGIGNAIVPQVASEILRCIQEIEIQNKA